jgi:hypothetical protein
VVGERAAAQRERSPEYSRRELAVGLVAKLAEPLRFAPVLANRAVAAVQTFADAVAVAGRVVADMPEFVVVVRTVVAGTALEEQLADESVKATALRGTAADSGHVQFRVRCLLEFAACFRNRTVHLDLQMASWPIVTAQELMTEELRFQEQKG